MYAPHTPRNPAPRLNAKYFARCECSVGADGNPPAKDCEASLDRGASAPLRRLMRIAKRRCRGTAERLLRSEG